MRYEALASLILYMEGGTLKCRAHPGPPLRNWKAALIEVEAFRTAFLREKEELCPC